MITESIITCPICQQEERVIMPLDACTYFYDCKYCLSLIKPKKGDCCVFCSYGTIKCPLVQKGEGCC